ncbi:hypothetical protein ACQQ63_11135, partial [Corynebacterium diphtheriae]
SEPTHVAKSPLMFSLKIGRFPSEEALHTSPTPKSKPFHIISSLPLTHPKLITTKQHTPSPILKTD